MMFTSAISILSLLMEFGACHGSTILAFFPVPVPSHHRVYQPLIRGLLDRGHKVTYFTPITLNNPPEDKSNFTEILIDDFIQQVKERMEAKTGITEKDMMKFQGMWFSQHVIVVMSKQYGLELGRMTMEDKKFKDFIDSDVQFDCVLYGGTFIQEMYAGLSHRFQAPLIEVHPAGNSHFAYWLHGNPYDTSYIVDFMVANSDRMSFLERVENTLNSALIRSVWYLYFWPKYEALMNQLLRYPGWESRPSLDELISKTSMVLMNTHYSLNYPYPLSPNFKEIGGINIIDPKPLPKDLQDYMDSAKEGVIYFSLGSHLNVSLTLNGGILEEFVKAFANVKQKVLWKSDDITNLPSNVKISKWYPQQAILSHKNCKLFISHGGFLSLAEAVNYGVPMVGTPVLADQQKNIKHMETNGYGVQLKLNNITEKSILWAINQVLDSPKYAGKIRKQSQLFRDKPETALETAVF